MNIRRSVSGTVGFFLLISLYSCKQRDCIVVKENAVLTFAPKPPMGWNSFDAYDCRINEADFKANVDVLADQLLEYGFEYATLDYIWWHPEPGNWNTPRRFGHPNIRYDSSFRPLYPEYTRLDSFGRCLPAVERFPSSAGGKGFKPLADYVHSKGLKFGLHIMRGIHRVAWYYDMPIMGTEFSARDIAEPWDTNDWCNHTFGVDPTKPGAQEYYNSLFKLYAEWGVDLIKADDMMRPPYHKGEVEMIRKAVENCGRPMVISLSCGEAPLAFGEHLAENSNMWRISADLWDNWLSVKHNFNLLNAWSSYIKPGNWPDADMLPIGRLSLNNRPHGPERESMLTWPEHYTVMSLWSIARSPLIIGGDLLTSSQESMAFFKNKEVIEVNQNSSGNRQVCISDTSVVWFANAANPDEYYFALFNISEKECEIEFDFEYEYLREKYNVRDLWEHKELGVYQRRFSKVLASHGAGLFKLTKIKN